MSNFWDWVSEGDDVPEYEPQRYPGESSEGLDIPAQMREWLGGLTQGVRSQADNWLDQAGDALGDLGEILKRPAELYPQAQPEPDMTLPENAPTTVPSRGDWADMDFSQPYTAPQPPRADPAAGIADLAGAMGNVPGAEGVADILGGGLGLIGQANEWARENVPGVAGGENALGSGLEWYGGNVVDPLAYAVTPEDYRRPFSDVAAQVQEQGGGWPEYWQALGEAERRRPEPFPGQKGLTEMGVDPLNLLPIGAGEVAGAVKAGARIVSPAVRKGGQVVGDVAGAVGRTVENPETQAVLRSVTPGLGVEDVSQGLTGKVVKAAGADPNTPYDFRYKVVSLDDLAPSHTDTLALNPSYPKELQARLRDRAASQLQISKTAQTLNPDALLTDVGTLDRGPMIVGPDDVVESGNGRTLALRLAREGQPEKWQAYQEALQSRLPEYGIDPQAVAGVKDPVLVRERLSEVDRPAFAAEANESSVLAMSPLEQALQDAGRISDSQLSSLTVGESQSINQALLAADNRSIVRSFIESIPSNEQAAVVGPHGELNAVGLERFKAALFAKTYPGDAGQRLTQVFFESIDPAVKNVEQGMLGSLPALARAEGLARSGARPAELSIGEDISKAVDMLARLKQRGVPVSRYVDQEQMWERELTPFQENLLQYFNENGRSPKAIRELLNAYAAGVDEAPDARQAAMFFAEPVTKEGLVERFIQGQTTERAAREPLFAGLPEEAATAAQVAPTGEVDAQLARGSLEPQTAGVEQVAATPAVPTKTKEPPVTHGESETAAALITVSPNDVSYRRAVAAHSGTSWVPEQRGTQVQADYVSHMERVRDLLLPYAKTPEQLGQLRNALTEYRNGYLVRLNAYLDARSRVVSTFIAGPSKFPTRMMEKRHATVENRLDELTEWSKKAQSAMRKEIAPETSRVISSDNPEAVRLLEQKVAKLTALQERMVAANKILRSKQSAEQKVEQLEALGISPANAQELLKPDFAGRIGYSYELTNNSAEVRRLQARVAELTRSRATPGGEMTFAGGHIVDNAEQNRIQILFDAKPDEATRARLKAHGFRWAPSEGAWQRQRTDNTRSVIQQLFPDAKSVESATPEEFIEPQMLDVQEMQEAPKRATSEPTEGALAPDAKAATFVAEQQAEGKTPTVGEIRQATGVDVPTAAKARQEKRGWYINADDRPVYTSQEDATQGGWRGPYTKQEAGELTGADVSYMKEDGKPVYTPDYPEPTLRPVPEPATAAPEQPQVSEVPEAPQEPPTGTTEDVIPAEVEQLPDVEPAQPTEAAVEATATPENAELPSATPEPAAIVTPSSDAAAQVDAFKADLIEQARAKIRDKFVHGEKVVIGDVRAWAKTDAPTAKQVLDEERAARKSMPPTELPATRLMPPERKPIWEGRTEGAPPMRGGPPAPPIEPPTGGLPSGRGAGGPERMQPNAPISDYERLVDALTPEKTGVRDKIRAGTDAIMRAMYDRVWNAHYIEDATGIPVHKLAQVVPGSIAYGEYLVDSQVMPVLKAIGVDIKYLEQYMVGRRMEDVLARNPHARLPGDVRGWGGAFKAIDGIKQEVGPERFQRIENAARELWRLNDELVLKPRLEAGLLSKQQYAEIKAANPHYISFYREDFTGLQTGLTKGEANVTNAGIHAMDLAGSTRKLDNPLARFNAQVIATRHLIAENNAAKSIVAGLMDMEKRGVQKGAAKAPRLTGERFAKVLKPGEGGEHGNVWDTISFLQDGRKVTTLVPTVYAKMANGLEAESADIVTKLARAAAFPLRAGAVTFNIAFMPKNVLRDMVSATFREGLQPVSKDYAGGWLAAIAKNEDYADAAKAGVLMSGIVENMRSTNALARAGQIGGITVRSPKDALLVIPRVIGRGLGAIERAGVISEQATRVATFKKLRAQGLNELDAAIRARDVTVDFAKAGNAIKIFNQWVPFTNAGVQGAANTLRTMRYNPKQALIASAPLAAATVIAWVNNKRYETATMIPEREYAMNWIFQFGEGTKQPDPKYPNKPGEKFPIYIRVPKGQIGALLTSPVETALRYAWANDDRSVLNDVGAALSTMATSLSPVEPSISGILPPMASTATGVQSNYDAFRGQPIVPRGEQDKPAELQFGPETSKVAVALGERFHVSPRIIDYAIKDTAAGVGSQTLWLSDLILGAVGYDPAVYGEARKQPLSDMQHLAKAPITGGFLGVQSSEATNKGWQAFDKAAEESQRAAAAVPDLRRLGVSIGPVSEIASVGKLRIVLTPQERAGLQKETTEALIGLVSRVTEVPSFRSARDAEKEKILRAVMEKGRRQARASYLSRLSQEELRRRVVESSRVPVAGGR